jgi:hypothetical protein
MSANVSLRYCYIERISAKGMNQGSVPHDICYINIEIVQARDRIREIPDKRIGSTHSQTNSPENGSSPSQ